MDHSSNRQFQLFVYRVLRVDCDLVTFHKRKPVIRHIPVRYPLPVQRIEPNPCAVFLHIANYCPDVVWRHPQQLDQLPRCLLVDTMTGWCPLGFSLCVRLRLECGGNVPHIFILTEQCPQILGQLLAWRFPVRSRQMLDLQPLFPDDLLLLLRQFDKAVHGNGGIFIHPIRQTVSCRRCSALFHAVLHKGGNGHRGSPIAEPLPAVDAVAVTVPAIRP